MYCSECGALIWDKAKFCVNCGVKIETIKTVNIFNMNFAFSAGRYYKLSEDYGNSFLTKASACKKELDSARSLVDVHMYKGSGFPEVEYPKFGFSKDDKGEWVYSSYKAAYIEYYPEIQIDEEFEIPDHIRDKYEINSICSEAFWGCKELRKLIIPKSIERIENAAFAGCENLNEVVIYGQWKAVGKEAFLDTQLYKNESNWTDGALYINNWLIKVKPEISGDFRVLDGTKGIADEAFWKCENITSVYIPDSVKYIGSSVFVYCSNVTDIRMPVEVESIGHSLFWHCGKLKEIIMPIGTKIIKNEFYHCSSLHNIEVPDNLESISYHAFNGTPYENNEKWENNIFEYKNYLLKVSRDFKDKFVVPDRLTVICKDAFWWCDNITEIVIHNSVTRIDEHAFSNCMALTELIIPESVKWIGRAIFNGCEAMRKVTILNPTVEMDEDMIAFWCKPKYLVIYGKEGSTAQKYAEKKKIPFKVID